jgi:hypothetical protein
MNTFEVIHDIEKEGTVPEVIDFIERFIDRALVFDSVMKNKLESLYQDINWEMPIFNKNVAKFFSFN